MPNTPAPLRNKTIQDAIEEVEKEIQPFFNFHKQHSGIIVQNPFFGDLNYEEWRHLLYKHAMHHLKQFGLIEII